MSRDYSPYDDDVRIITKFEEYESALEIDFGEEQDDFMEWFLIFRAGFLAGGMS
jgi:hypothetical protein